MSLLRSTPRLARVLHAWIACVVLGVAVAPVSVRGEPDRIVVVSEVEETPELREESTAQARVAESLARHDRPAACAVPSKRSRAERVRAPCTALYLQHCALLL
jgi:hypothetical protein